jgi:2-iminobutanoate/2-iminopropanoate deaminase
MHMAEKDVIRTERAPAPFQGAPYNQAIRLGELVFVAGQVGVDVATGELVGPTIGEQTEQILRNMAAILEEAGSGMDKLLKTTVFLADFSDFAGMNEVYTRHVGDRPPARSTIGVAELPIGARIEIEAIAHI